MKTKAIIIPARGEKTGIYKYYQDYYNNKVYKLTAEYNSYAPLYSHYMYLISDDELKQGDWCLYWLDSPENGKLYFSKKGELPKCNRKKIIASNDTSLQFLPNIPDNLIETYINSQGKINEFELETEPFINEETSDVVNCLKSFNDNVIYIEKQIRDIFKEKISKNYIDNLSKNYLNNLFRPSLEGLEYIEKQNREEEICDDFEAGYKAALKDFKF